MNAISYPNPDGTFTLKVDGVKTIVTEGDVNRFWERMSWGKLGKPYKK